MKFAYVPLRLQALSILRMNINMRSLLSGASYIQCTHRISGSADFMRISFKGEKEKKKKKKKKRDPEKQMPLEQTQRPIPDSRVDVIR